MSTARHFDPFPSASGWSFRISDGASPGGLVLQEVYHQGHRFATDVRIVGVWINNTTFLRLGDEKCPCIPDSDGNKRTFLKQPEAPGVFSKYVPQYGFESSYSTTEPKKSDRIEFTQQYLFTGYGKSPAHEPAAVLSATRLFPLLRFKTDNKDIETVRVDYRLALSLDGFASVLETIAKNVSAKRPVNLNQVGIFRDFDSLPLDLLTEEKAKELGEKAVLIWLALKSGPIGANVPSVADIFIASVKEELKNQHKNPGDVLFEAAKKPLKYEIVGYGLESGGPSPDSWDNIHWWDARSKQNLPSAPGAFHAAHIHWRWPAEVANPKAETLKRIRAIQDDWKIKVSGLSKVAPSEGALGEIQFGPPLIAEGLVDPMIPHQTIRFAIVQSGDPALAADTAKTSPDFSSLFTQLGGDRPKAIADGAELVLWLSFEVRRYLFPLGGTVFIHGIYFAHDLETLTPTAFTRGESAEKPKEEKTWMRGPNES